MSTSFLQSQQRQCSLHHCIIWQLFTVWKQLSTVLLKETEPNLVLPIFPFHLLFTSINPVCTSPSWKLAWDASLPRKPILVFTPATCRDDHMLEYVHTLVCIISTLAATLAAHLVVQKGVSEFVESWCPVFRPHHQFSNHGVIIRRDFITYIHINTSSIYVCNAYYVHSYYCHHIQLATLFDSSVNPHSVRGWWWYQMMEIAWTGNEPPMEWEWNQRHQYKS